MSRADFSVDCYNCGGEVTGWTQSIKYVLFPNASSQAGQTIFLSCGCVVDFPDWQIDLDTGRCKIIGFSGQVFIEFMDEEMLKEDDE